MHRNQSVNVHQFSMIPRADIPRATFDRQTTHKTTFDAGYLVPIFCDEVLPGDTFNLKATIFTRMATPIFPILDNLYLDTFFFFVPNRLVWTHWVNFMGEQANPADSISYSVPQCVSPVGGYATGSLQDYFGLPTVGQLVAGNTDSSSNLPLRAYNLIYNQWFRDENLQNSVVVDTGDGPDLPANYTLLRRGKRADYFTSCLPWPQKGGVPVSIPLGTSAPIRSTAAPFTLSGPTGTYSNLATTGLVGASPTLVSPITAGNTTFGPINTLVTSLYADLSTATAATINQLRLSFQTQKLLERDARGGTRYTEIILSHFGVRSPDMRLQRPEYLGGGSVPIIVNPVAQTSATGVTGGSTPGGTLNAYATGLHQGSTFSQSFTEHGHIIGLASIRADLTYQQGKRRMWNRLTRYDFYFPAFAMIGEQAVTNDELYCDGSVNDNTIFGYQERWAEYRYFPSMITSVFKSTSALPLDTWHLAQKFTAAPTLNTTFIQDTPPVSRVVAAGSLANGQQFLVDMFFDIRTARPLPMYSVPGLIDHF